MNQSNIDYLYQILPPGGERPAQPTRSDHGGFGFGEHLSQASASVFEVPPPAKREPSRPGESTTRERDDSSSQPETATTRPVETPPQREKTNDAASSSASEEAASSQVAEAKQEPEENRTDDDSDDNQTESEAASLAAAASQPAHNAKPEQSAHQAEGENVQKTKAEIAAAATAQATDSDNSGKGKAEEGTDGVATTHRHNRAATDKVNDETKNEAASKADTEKSTADTKKPTKAASRPDSAHPEQAQKLAEAATTDESNATKSAQVRPEVAAASTETAPDGEANSKVAKSKLADDSEKRGDDASAANAANPAGENAPIDAKPVNTSPTSAIANNIAASATLTDSNKPKGDGENTTKPVSTKSESAVGPLGRALRTATDVTRNGSTSKTQEGPQVDPSRFVGRVAKAFQAANERGGTVQLRLAPPELGSLKIQMRVTDGVMSATVEADNATARRLLLDHLPALRDRLAEQNIRIEKFDVDVRQESNSGGQANPQGSNQNPYQQQAEQTGVRRVARGASISTEATTAAVPMTASRITTTEINLVV